MSAVTRRWLLVLLGAALLMSLTAGPLSAAKATKKTYSVTVDPATVPLDPNGVDQTFTLRYTNTTPGGVASFNSLSLTAPAGFTITLASVVVTTSSGDTGFSVVPSAAAPNITVTNLYPVSYGEWVQIAFTAQVVMSGTTCSSAVGTWLTQAWTGSNTSGSLFELSGTPPTTTVGTAVAPGASIIVNGVTLTNIGTTCAPVTLSREGNEVHVYKPNDPSLAFTVDIDAWDPTAPTTWTQVDTPGGFHPIKWCLGTWTPADPTNMTSITMPAYDTTTSEVSCLLGQETTVAGVDPSGNPLVRVREWIYLTDDWGAKHG